MGQDPHKDRTTLHHGWMGFPWAEEGMYHCESGWVFNVVEGIHA